jgi:K+-sensing histidine kinase KdpD
MENLTQNAASRATEVELSVTRAGDLVTMQISDNEPGFDEEILPHVFERFCRGDTRGSTGLGMAIAKSIVEAHGGSVSAANPTTGGAIVKLHRTHQKVSERTGRWSGRVAATPRRGRENCTRWTALMMSSIASSNVGSAEKI